MLSRFPFRSLALATSLALLILLAVVAPGASADGGGDPHHTEETGPEDSWWGHDPAAGSEEALLRWLETMDGMAPPHSNLGGVAGQPGYEGEGDADQAPLIPQTPKLRHPSLGSHLDQLLARVEAGEMSAQDAAEGAYIHREESVAVTIHLSGNVGEVVEFLVINGGDPRNIGEDYIEAYVPVMLLGRASDLPGVIRVREIVPPQPDYGPFTSQGVPAHGSPAWHQAGITGRGVKVGIIDLGFEGFRGLMGTELPATVQARCYTEVGRYTTNMADCEDDETEGDNHGTIVAETVMDMAPDVSLYIAHPRSWGDEIRIVDWMVSQGVSVINRSLSSPFDGPGDGTYTHTDSPLRNVDRAVDGGIIWVNSAGNAARGTWFGEYADANGNGWIEFSGADQGIDMQLVTGQGIMVQLRWEGSWNGADSDLNLFVVDNVTRDRVGISADPQTGEAGHYPYERLYFEAPSDGEYDVFVQHVGGSAPEWIQVMVRGVGSIEHATGHHSITSPGESKNLGMLAVGAAPWYNLHTVESYSSRGPTPDGRFKPDVVGATCGETSLTPLNQYNHRGFCGTSQASPHVAGLAALVRQRFPDYTPQQVAAYLKDEADPRGDVPGNTWGHGFAFLPSSNRDASPDRDALVALYHATGGDNWTNWANWLSVDVPIGLWYGVTTDINGRVTRLDLRQNQLTGEIPAQLGSLANLEGLYLWRNQLTGEIPSELSSLSDLEELNLRTNKLTGTIPTELGNLANLKVLNLTQNQLAGGIPTELSSLTNLTVLALGYNQLAGTIPTWLGSLANLEGLYLWGNNLSGPIPTELGNLANLELLYISQNQLAGGIPTELGDLANLKELFLCSNQLGGEIPVELGSLANLEELCLWGNELTGEIPSELNNLTNLTVLSLSDNQLTGPVPTWLGNLANLELLYISRNQLTGEIPPELGDLANLKGLSLYSNQLGGEIPVELGNLTNLEVLSLYNNQLTGEIPSELGNLPKLERLLVSRNQLTGQIPSQLDNLANLEELCLWGNELTGEIPSELNNLTNLTVLSLSDNQLTGPVPTWLGNLANLELLYISRNQLTGEIPPELGDLANLKGLSLYSNQLGGEIPVELGNLTNLEVLSLYNNQLTGEIPSELGNLPKLERLLVSRNQLTGQIPSQLDNLVNLEDLYLWGNELTGAIPPELGNLSNLKDLYLGKNQLSGAIPPELGGLTNLERLALNENLLNGEIPSELGKLTKLTELYLHSNQLNGRIPSELGNLVNPTGSVLGGNQTSVGITSEPSGLASLTELDLGRNRWLAVIPSEPGNLAILEGLSLQEQPAERSSIPSESGDLSGLERLWLYDNQLSGSIPAELGNLANLEELYLWDNWLSGEIPAELGNLSNLMGLGIRGNELSGCVPASLKGRLDMSRTDLGGLPFCGDTAPIAPSASDRAALVAFYHATDGPNWENDNNWLTSAPIGLWHGVTADPYGRVTELALGGNELSGAIPPELGDLASLEELYLWGNQLTGKIPSELGSLSALTWLSLVGNQLSGEIPSELGNLSSLENLRLWSNQLTGEIPSQLSSLANLTELDLSGNQLTGEIPPELSSLTNLIELALDKNQLTGEIPSELGNLSSLESLNLSDNRLDSKIPQELGDLANLESLWLHENQLSGEIPPELGKLSNLTALSLGINRLTGEIPSELGSLSNLTDLYLERNQLSGEIPSQLGNLPKLTILWLNDNQLHGEIPSELGELDNLKSVAFRDNQLTGCVPAGLRDVTGNDFTELGLPFCEETAPPMDPCLETLSGDDSVSGQWAPGCESETVSRDGSGAYPHARFYTFTLGEESEVTITLESQDADSLLYLRDGEAKSGTALHENDDHEGSTSRSQIKETLPLGTYTVEATTYYPSKTGSFTLTVSGLGGTASSGTRQTIVFSDLNWNSAMLQNRIAQYIVETGYGYLTDVAFGASLQLLEALSRGESHVSMEVWLPNQSDFWDPALEAGEVLDLGPSLGQDWQSAFVIPAYLQEQHPELDSVDDLKEQRYKNLFQTEETGGKALLVSCVVGWACEPINAAQVTGYGLDEHVHIVNPVSGDALFASINGAYQRQEPWLGYMWGTGDPALLLDLVRLEEPPYSDECWDSTMACAYEDATVLIGAHSSLPEQAPEVVEFLRKWDFAVDPHLRNVTRWQEANPDASIKEAALHWLRNNADTWTGWVTGDAAVRILSALSQP